MHGSNSSARSQGNVLLGVLCMAATLLPGAGKCIIRGDVHGSNSSARSQGNVLLGVLCMAATLLPGAGKCIIRGDVHGSNSSARSQGNVLLGVMCMATLCLASLASFPASFPALALYPGHVGGGKSGLVSTVCACAKNPMISWGIVYHRLQTVNLYCILVYSSEARPSQAYPANMAGKSEDFDKALKLLRDSAVCFQLQAQ